MVPKYLNKVWMAIVFLVVDHLSEVLACRLVRKTCAACGERRNRRLPNIPQGNEAHTDAANTAHDRSERTVYSGGIWWFKPARLVIYIRAL